MGLKMVFKKGIDKMNCKENLKEYIDKDEILKLSLKLSHDEITLKEYFEEIKKMEEEFAKCIL